MTFHWTGINAWNTMQQVPISRYHGGHHQRRALLLAEQSHGCSGTSMIWQRGTLASTCCFVNCSGRKGSPGGVVVTVLTPRELPGGKTGDRKGSLISINLLLTQPCHKPRLALALLAAKKEETFTWFIFTPPFSTNRFSSPALLTESRATSEI